VAMVCQTRKCSRRWDMRRTLIFLIVAGVSGVFGYAMDVQAATLTLSPDQLLLLWDVFENPEHATTELSARLCPFLTICVTIDRQ
jgi:hypothetical protein